MLNNLILLKIKKGHIVGSAKYHLKQNLSLVFKKTHLIVGTSFGEKHLSDT